MVHELALESPEEALDTGVVPAISRTAHAGDDVVLAEQTFVIRGGILTAAIRMVQEPGPWAPIRQRHGERLLASSSVNRLAHPQPMTRREYRSSITAR